MFEGNVVVFAFFSYFFKEEMMSLLFKLDVIQPEISDFSEMFGWWFVFIDDQLITENYLLLQSDSPCSRFHL